MRSELQLQYANTFKSSEGRKVLGDILTLGHFGEILSATPEKSLEIVVAEFNFAITIARMAGMFDLIYPQVGIAVEGERDGRNSTEL